MDAAGSNGTRSPSPVPKKVPARINDFIKASSDKALPAPQGSELEGIAALLGGKYTNEGQDALIPHVYELTPIWEGKSKDTYWFYEGISNAFDDGDPFSRHIISIHTNQEDKVVWTYYYCDSLKTHNDIYKNPAQLDYIQIEDLMLLDHCEITAIELRKDHFLFRTTSGNCRDWNMTDGQLHGL